MLNFSIARGIKNFSRAAQPRSSVRLLLLIYPINFHLINPEKNADVVAWLLYTCL